MTPAQVAFGSQLRRERERRQITLASVAESTKISKSLLGSLEQGDASQWPKGIYRRAFIREYATFIGLPTEAIAAEFQRLFPEPGAAESQTPRGSSDGSALRLTLAHEERWFAQSIVLRAVAAILDGAAVLALSAAIATLLAASFWAVTGGVALIYQSIATTWMGGSATFTLIDVAFSRRAEVASRRSRPRPSSREVLRIVPTASRSEEPDAHDEAEARYLENARSAS